MSDNLGVGLYPENTASFAPPVRATGPTLFHLPALSPVPYKMIVERNELLNRMSHSGKKQMRLLIE